MSTGQNVPPTHGAPKAVSTVASGTAEAVAREARPAPPLPCLKRNNCTEDPAADRLARALAYSLRGAYGLELNARELCKRGLERIGFLSLTLADQLYWWDKTDWREAQKRFHSLRSHVLKELFEDWMVVLEPQKSGRIHWHLLVVCHENIREGINFAEIAQKNYRSANPALHKLWTILREKMPEYGFGRHELLPIKTTGEAIAKYIAKYLGKSLHNCAHVNKKPPRMRRVRYSLGWKVCSMRFQWYRKGKAWRAALAWVCPQFGLTDERDMALLFGPKWAYLHGTTIMDLYERRITLPPESQVVKLVLEAFQGTIIARL